MVTPATTDAIMSTVSIIQAVAAVVYAIFLSWRERSPVPFLIVLGGGTVALIEPIVDVLGGCWYPRRGGWIAFHQFDSPVPMWAVANYFWYVGGMGYLALRYITRNPGREAFWKMCAVVFTVDVLMEAPTVFLHVYDYWGQQPLNPYGFPLWWAAVNAGLPLVGAMLIYKLQPLLTGWRLFLIVPLIPMGDGLVNGATAWPAWLALNSNWPMPLTQVAGVAVFGLAALFYWAMGHLAFPEPTDGGAPLMTAREADAAH
jgi:hypothetical protein